MVGEMASSQRNLVQRFEQIHISDESRVHMGNNYNTTNIHPAAAERPPKPLSTIPFARDPDYIHRGPLVHEIHEKLSLPGARIALVGLGGVGKSQLAIEYGHHVREESQSTWVFWLYASSSARLEQSVRDTLDQLRVPGRENPDSNVFQLFRSWLRDTEHRRWLIILDNVDDEQVLLNPPQGSERSGGPGRQDRPKERCLDYLPPSSHGSILVTSRSKDVASKIVERKALVTVDPMDEEHAVLLATTKLVRSHSRQDAAELARALDYMPLAITQAAAYIDQSLQCSVKQYLERLQKSDKSWQSFLKHDASDFRRDQDAKNSILLTLQVSFDHIYETSRSAANLLSLMCMFDSQAIPASALVDWSEPSRHIGKAFNDWTRTITSRRQPKFKSESSKHRAGEATHKHTALQNDLRTLLSYSLISVNAGISPFKMHRLVHLATQAWLEFRGRLEQWKSRFITNLDEAFPEILPNIIERWPEIRQLYPSTVLALRTELKSKSASLRQASLLLRSGMFAQDISDLPNAANMMKRSMDLRLTLLRDGHEDTLHSMLCLVGIYRAQHRLKEAEDVQTTRLKLGKRSFGEENEETISDEFRLAETCCEQGRLEEAEKLQVATLHKAKRVLGYANPITMDGLQDLACTYARRGELKQAEELQSQELETRTRVLGHEHPHTLMSMSQLAWIYYCQEQFQEAEELQVKILHANSEMRGPTHLETLDNMGDLALTYDKQGRVHEAVELQRKAFDALKRLLGLKHQKTLASMQYLALILRNAGRRQSSGDLIALCAELSESVLGPSHETSIYRMKLKRRYWHNQGSHYSALLQPLECELEITHCRGVDSLWRACRRHS